MRTIKKSDSLRQQVYDILKEELLTKEVTDEEILYERKISEELNVSRTPVREALKALEAEGLVAYVPYKGIVVKKMNEIDLKNIFQIRKALEILTIELAMLNISKEYVKEMEESLKQQNALLKLNHKENKEYFIDLDVNFHSSLLKMADNDLLTIMIGEIRDKIRRFGMSAIFCGDFRYKETVDEHSDILKAIKARNLDLAREKMNYHIQKTYENAYNYITVQKSVKNNSL